MFRGGFTAILEMRTLANLSFSVSRGTFVILLAVSVNSAYSWPSSWLASSASITSWSLLTREFYYTILLIRNVAPIFKHRWMSIVSLYVVFIHKAHTLYSSY